MTLTIKTKRERLGKKIAELQEQIRDLMVECTHPHLTGKYDANTGNWCSGDDSYWIDYECPDCGKVWMEDQSDSWFDMTHKVLRSKDGYAFTKVDK